jgi:hypothetical protein
MFVLDGNYDIYYLMSYEENVYFLIQDLLIKNYSFFFHVNDSKRRIKEITRNCFSAIAKITTFQ